MKIGIDARALKWPRTGIGKYVNEVVKFISNETDDEAILFSDVPISLPEGFNGKQEIFAAPKRFIWENNLLPSHIDKLGIDVYHAAWNYGLAKSIKCACLLTVHDVIPVILEDLYFKTMVERVFYRTIYLQSMRSSIERADYINTVSANTKNDLVRLFNVLDSKMRVVHQGHDEAFKPIDNEEIIDEVLQRHGVTKPFVIYSGGFDVRKNLIRLLDAWKIVNNTHPDIAMVLVGELNEYGKKVVEYGEKIGTSGSLIFPGFVSESDMAALINGAKLAVYPSLYEGFGLPPLEAMACGKAVAVSSRASIPEVVGSAGVYFDPENVEQITEAIEELLRDIPENDMRRGFALRRAADFSWRATTEAVYESYSMARIKHEG